MRGSVEHLLKTGEYRLDAWSAANMPVQIYVAAGLAEGVRLFAQPAAHRDACCCWSPASPRSYALLRELDVAARVAAAVLALGLLASPLVAMLSFTFMSDVQFMALAADRDLALQCAASGRASDATVLLASLAAACAIGTRQFGVAVIGGLLHRRAARRPTQRAHRWRRLLLGAAIPLLVGLMAAARRLHRAQLHAGRPPARASAGS